MSDLTIHQQYLALKDARQKLQLEYFDKNYCGELNYEYRKGTIDRLKAAENTMDFLRHNAPEFNEFIAMKNDQGLFNNPSNEEGAS